MIVWSYPGRTQADAAQLFARHAAELVPQGYEPTSQSWADGRPGTARVFMFGVFAQSRRPKGFLTVTYRRRVSEGAAAAGGDDLDKIRRLGELRDAGLITAEEFEAKKAQLLERM